MRLATHLVHGAGYPFQLPGLVHALDFKGKKFHAEF